MKYEIVPYENHHLEALKVIFDKNVPEYFDASEWSDFEGFVAETDCPYYVIQIEGNVVGAFGYGMNDATTGAVIWIFFDTDIQKLGLGRISVQYCHDHLSKLGANKVVVRTSQKTEGFFGKQGYEVTHRESDYWGAGLDLVVMEYILPV